MIMSGDTHHSAKPAKQAVRQGAALDISALPTFAFGPRSTTWWGTMGMVLVEGTVFALGVMSYFYLRSQSDQWPDGGIPPDLMWGTLNTLLMLLSCVPNWWTNEAAKQFDLRKVRIGLCICMVFSLLFLGGRVGEFASLNVKWSDNAYGSVTWMLLGLHTTHLITDTYNTLVLTVLFFTGPVEAKRFVDVSENAAYWYFVVISWVAIYAVIYGGARL
nr:cytochrome c oxidase subunit 3 [Herbaspirillum lusitanum]